MRSRAQLELAPSLSTINLRAARAHRELPGKQRSAAQVALATELGARTLLHVDADTGVPALVIPDNHVVVGQASDFARAFVDRHIAALAPGSVPGDFVLVSDETSPSGVRTIGFAQHHAGVPVLGGQLSLSFKAGRLIAVRSLALPHVQVQSRQHSVTPERAAARAREWIAADFSPHASPHGLGLTTVSVPAGAPMILPLIDDHGRIDYREVVAVEVSLAQPQGRWLVYLDAADGSVVARRSLLHWADLRFITWERSPLGEQVAFPAAYLNVDVAGQPQQTDAFGNFDVAGGNTPFNFSFDGAYAFVLNESGPALELAGQAAPSSTHDYGSDIDEELAQINAYVHTQVVKDYIRGIDPGFSVPDMPTQVTVNIGDVCNAFADGNTINFFSAGGGCENTGLIADVIYHEYGHVAHVLGLQPGVGVFDGAVSEGASDYLSATMTNDPDLSPGFFQGSDEPLRELDPDGYEWHWPEDTGEVHDEGRIIGGTLWDLRKALIAKHGPSLGVAKTDLIWLDGIRRSVDMPSWYVEALITNDDDGNLQNGTPDICEITEAFAAHGLYSALDGSMSLEQVVLGDGSLQLTLDYGEPFAGCPGSISPSAELVARPRHAPSQTIVIAMSDAGPGQLRAVLPPQPDATVTQFQIRFDWGNGTTAVRPDNRGDEWYEHYNGPVTPIWCSDFESNDGWTTTGEFSLGVSGGGSGDPGNAFSGQSVAGVALALPGSYTPFSQSSLRSPTIDTSGFEGVRLQYYRWLNVEDGFYDQAWITANGSSIWENYASDIDFLASVHHRDREWRFHDIDLAEVIGPNGQLTLEFNQISDAGLEFGGWTIDALCVVSSVPPDGGCGDGYVQETEQCDDGNLDNGDGCSSGCLFELPPKPPEEPIDDGWDPDGRGCGCTTTDPSDGAPLGPLPAAAPLLLLLAWRRRAR